MKSFFGAASQTWTDDLLIHTTTIFIANNVCGLDFLFAIAYALGTPYKVSTLQTLNALKF